MKDFRVIVRLYNNQLRERREATGLRPVPFARSIGVDIGTYCRYEQLAQSPLSKKYKAKRWTPTALKVAAAFGVEPSVIFPDAALEIRASIAERRMDAEEMATCLSDPKESSPFGLLTSGEERLAVIAALDKLNPQERKVIAMRFGLDDHDETTLSEIGEVLGVSPERARQVEAKALRKFRQEASIRELMIGRGP